MSGENHKHLLSRIRSLSLRFISCSYIFPQHTQIRMLLKHISASFDLNTKQRYVDSYLTCIRILKFIKIEILGAPHRVQFESWVGQHQRGRRFRQTCCTRSYPWQCVEVGGQHHDSVSGYSPWYPLNRRERGTQNQTGRCDEAKFGIVENWALFKSVVRHHSDWATQAHFIVAVWSFCFQWRN
jgi:hypothetical protein